jgi:AhpC/TSA family
LPSVHALYQDLRPKGFELVLIGFREDPELIRQTAQDRGYTARVLIDPSGDVTGNVYGVWGPPTVYFIDRQGRIVGRAVGPRDWNTPAARRFVTELLAQDAPALPKK